MLFQPDYIFLKYNACDFCCIYDNNLLVCVGNSEIIRILVNAYPVSAMLQSYTVTRQSLSFPLCIHSAAGIYRMLRVSLSGACG